MFALTMRWRALLPILALLMMSSGVGAQQPIVRGVFFYSPTCPHCHEVITNHWPNIAKQFGNQLQIMFVDVSTPGGSALMTRTTRALGIASNGVPMLIIGDEVMIGSADIPARAATVIAKGLETGGVELPNVAGLQEAFDRAFAGSEATEQELPTPPPVPERLAADPANYLAVMVLIGLVVLLAFVAYGAISTENFLQLSAKLNRPVTLGLIVLAAALVISLVTGSTNNAIALGLAVLVMLFIGLAAYEALSGHHTDRLLPLTALSGLIVAGYLAYVETTLTEATCGVIGDCNTVQQSPYAQILGIPIGLIGVAGYLAILAVWLYKHSASQDKRADLVLFGMAAFGVVFSVYLTFLEPFVIGASCVWCLTSAVLMGLTLWLTAPSALDALRKSRLTKRIARRT